MPGGAGSLVGPGVGPPGAPTLRRSRSATGLGVGRYQYAYTDVTANGETLPSPVASIDLGGVVAAPTAAPTLAALSVAGAIAAGVHTWAYTFTSGGGGETLPSPTAALDTRTPLTPIGGITNLTAFNGGVLLAGNYYHYRVTYVGDAGETTAAPYTRNVLHRVSTTAPTI